MTQECKICNGFGSVQGTQCPCQIEKTPDEKVLDYLERARKIEQKFTGEGASQETYEGYQANVIEIAKLLQREESK